MASPIDGGTVLVTGASSGIGVEIARQIAMRARVLILVARRAERLAKLKEELLTRRRDLMVEVIPADLGNRAEVDRVVGELRARNIDVDVLVNNAGVGMMGVLDRADTAKTLAMVDINVVAPTQLTLALLPGMVERRRGGILNVSSGFGLAVMPTFAAYCATKHYMTGLTEALVGDLAGTGVTATQVCPGPVATEFEENIGNFTGMKAPSFVEITAAQCARAAIRGFDRGRAMVIPSFLMKIVMAINGMSPRFMRRLFASIVGRGARRKQLGAIKEAPRSP
jgi:short-subunit dehydrogenase